MEKNEVKIKNKKKQQKQLLLVAKIGVALLSVVVMAWLVNRFIFRSRATQDIATVTFSPQANHVVKNQVFNQTIRVNSGDKKISGVDITVNYDASKLKYLENKENLLNQTVPINYFDTYVLERTIVQNIVGTNGETIGKGQTRITLVANKPDEELGSDVVISLQFQALETVNLTEINLVEASSAIVGTTGTTDSLDHTFDIDSNNAISQIVIGDAITCSSDAQCGTQAQCASSSTCVCNQGFYNCDNNWVNGCEATTVCQPTGGVKLKLALKLQGINTTPVTAKGLKFKVSAIGTNNNKQGPKEVELLVSDRNDGIFEGTVDFEKLMPESNFRLFIKGPKHVQKRICDAKPTGGTDYYCSNEQGFALNTGINEIDLTQTPLLAGDLPLPEQDGILNSKDIVAIRNCIKDRTDECVKQTDVNYDGVTNGTDFTIVINSMGIKYDDEN